MKKFLLILVCGLILYGWPKNISAADSVLTCADGGGSDFTTVAAAKSDCDPNGYESFTLDGGGKCFKCKSSDTTAENETTISPEAAAPANFGSINPITGSYGNIEAGAGGLAKGPIAFANAIITFSATVLGIWFLISIIMQGIKVINNKSDPKALNEAIKKIVWNIVGIAIVALAYVIAGWVSMQLFGDENEILNPTIGATTTK